MWDLQTLARLNAEHEQRIKAMKRQLLAELIVETVESEENNSQHFSDLAETKVRHEYTAPEAPISGT